MAGVPCVNDTCSITAAVDVNGRLELSARLAALGGIVCGTGADPNAGLLVAINGDPAAVSPASLSACDNLLGITTEGKLFARRPQYELITSSGTVQDFPQNNTDSAIISNITITNTGACSRLMLIETSYQVNASIPTQDAGGSAPYYLDGAFVFEVNGATQSAAGFEIGGDNSNTEDVGEIRHFVSRMDMITIGSGAALILTTFAGGGEGQNITTSGGVHGVNASQRIAMLDLAAGNLFS